MKTVLIQRKLQDGSIQELSVPVIVVGLNRNFLNKVIKWSSYRYETWKKKEVVEHIFKAMNEKGFKQKRYNDKKEIEEVTITTDCFHSGSYCECSSMTRKGTYYVDYLKRVLIDCVESNSGEIHKIYQAYEF